MQDSVLCLLATQDHGTRVASMVLRARTCAREGILPELSLLRLFVGRSAPNPPPPFPHPLFSFPHTNPPGCLLSTDKGAASQAADPCAFQ